MELDDLKAKWQIENSQNLQLNKKDMEQLNLISQKAIEKLMLVKKNYKRIIVALLFGLSFNILLSPILPFILGEPGPLFRFDRLTAGFLAFISISCLLPLVFYWNKYVGMDVETSKGNLKSSLEASIERLKRARKTELHFISALFVCLFVAGRIGSQVNGNGDFLNILEPDIMLSLLLGLGILSFYIYKRGKVYQQNIQEFKKYLSDIKDPEK